MSRDANSPRSSASRSKPSSVGFGVSARNRVRLAEKPYRPEGERNSHLMIDAPEHIDPDHVFIPPHAIIPMADREMNGDHYRYFREQDVKYKWAE